MDNANSGKSKYMRRPGILQQALVLLMAFMVLIGLFMISTGVTLAEGEEKKEIEIEVVEDIPAQDIEEKAVPLAALPQSDLSNGLRHAGLMLIVLVMTVAYAIYFSRYEKKLILLREKAAEAESAARTRRKLEKSERTSMEARE